MNSARGKGFEAGVYDPSRRRAETSSYWQWTTASAGKEWTLAAERVNTGWPAIGGLFDLESKWYGFIADGEGKCWIYRLYAAGRDSFGRQGRYFFVLVRLEKRDLLSPKVAGLFRYFDSERGLPLRTQPLDQGWPEASPDEVLQALEQEVRQGRVDGHWGIDDRLQVTVFPERLRTERRLPNPSPFSNRGRHSTNSSSLSDASPGQVARDVLDFWRRHGTIYLFAVFTLVIALLGWRWWNETGPKPPESKCPERRTRPVQRGRSGPEPPPTSPAPPATSGVPAKSIEKEEVRFETGSSTPENPKQKQEVTQ
jgi:hypothetical protein